MSKSVSGERIGQPCPVCARPLEPPHAIVTREGKLLCKCRAKTQRLAWLQRHHPERISGNA